MYCRPVKIKELKKRECFTLHDVTSRDFIPDNIVYIRDEFDHSEKKYSCYKADDFCNYRLYKGDKVVFTDFTY